VQFHKESSPVWRRTVRRSTRGICILDCVISGRRKQSSNSLESLLRRWNRLAVNCILLSFADDDIKSLSEGSYQTQVSSICIVLGRNWNLPAGRVPYWLVFKRYWRTMIGTCGAWWVVSGPSTNQLNFISSVKVSIRFRKMRSSYSRIPFQLFFSWPSFFLF
jgi:hypothetical protein